MQAEILHRVPGQARFHLEEGLSAPEEFALKKRFEGMGGVTYCRFSPLTGNLLLRYEESSLPGIARFLLGLDRKTLQEEQTEAWEEEGDLFHLLRDALEARLVYRYLLPYPVRLALTFYRAAPYLVRGWKALRRRKLNVDVLDATAIGVSLATADFKTASSTMFLLQLGEEMEAWTLKKSKGDLTSSLSIHVDRVFVREAGQVVQKPFAQLQEGDLVEVHMGNMIPVDGQVVDGMGMVNQASFTGESQAVKKEKGSGVFAGTVLEEGRLTISCTGLQGNRRMDHIVRLIEESEANKSKAQKEAETRADALVKYSFLGALLTFAFTRNLTKAKAFLMVDYSCSLRLTIPIAVMKAMSQASREDILVKGGKFMEKLDQADTVVFDKTGTLTQAVPTVEKVLALGEYSETECLRIAACLEEHFPHSIANAVVEEARRRKLRHEEMHTEPEYIVAHGIASSIEGMRACIGSEHFILEDEGVPVDAESLQKIKELKEEYSLLYLSIDEKLVALICFTDPVRPDAAQTVKTLRQLGVSKICMLTGDSENSASYLARRLDLDYYQSQVLPEDKSTFIRQEQAKGRTVVMIGDGINDSIALSEADVGIAMHQGADLAREISDVAIGRDDLQAIVDVIRLSRSLQRRIHKDYRGIIGFNSALIALGFFGLLSNTSSSFLHNSSTVLFALNNMKDYTL